MIVLVSLIVYIAKKTSCSHCFSHGTSLHQHSFSRMVYIYTCFTYFWRSYIARMCSCAHAQIYGAAPCHHVLSAVKMASCLVASRIQCSVARLVTA